MWDAFQSFASHHQFLIILMIISGMTLISWGIESILENHVFKNKPFYGYVIAITVGFLFLIFTKHFVLRLI